MNGSLVGYLAALIAVLCFGSNFVPLKKVDIGDGVFFQFIMCCAIFMTSFPILCIQNFPPFHVLAMLGGFLWCTGNMLCGPIIQLVGMGLGLLIWGSTNMIMGWASGTFGLFGLTPEDIKYPALNYAGISLALVGLIVYLQVKSSAKRDMVVHDYEELSIPLAEPAHHGQDPLISDVYIKSNDPRLSGGGMKLELVQDDSSDNDYNNNNSNNNSNNHYHHRDMERIVTFGSNWSPKAKRVIGLSMACFTGILFGCSFDPSQYIIDHDYDGEDDTLNYVFPHFFGIILTSWAYTIIYTIYQAYHSNELYINPKCILPATMSGILWGVAEIAWFVANGRLGFSVAFPLITSGPGFIGALWGVFYFKEISGTRNLLMLSLAFAITLPGLIMIAMSH